MAAISATELGIIATLGILLSWVGTAVIQRWAARFGLLDIPNQRSLHASTTPRSGGISFVVVSLALIVGAAYRFGAAMPAGSGALLLASFIVAIVSLADDRWQLHPVIRLTAHLSGALVVVAAAGVLRGLAVPVGAAWEPGWTATAITVIWIVGLTNAYNFMDGIDGLAAGQAVVTSIAIAILSYMHGAEATKFVMVVLASSVFGFLLHNWPPAKIFMGDVGSAFLGFTFAGWSVLSSQSTSGALPFEVWLLVLAPFLLDTSTTLVRRIIRGEKWYLAHREHFYQRLVQNGWSHRAVTGLYMTVAAALSLAALGYYGIWPH